jgi:hypothetical protein
LRGTGRKNSGGDDDHSKCDEGEGGGLAGH